MKKTAFLLAALLLGACAAPKIPRTIPLDAVDEAKLREAAQALSREDYLGFKRAFQLYTELYAQPKLRRVVAENCARAGLLFGVRAKELGILDPEPLETVGRLIAENPGLAAYQPLHEVAGLIALKSKGIMGEGDSRIERYLDRPADLKKLLGTLVDRWTSDLLTAYVLAAFHGCYPSQGIGLMLEDFTRYYPASRLLGFVQATCGEQDAVRLQGLLEREPSLAEASENIERAKKLLGNSQVYVLSGAIKLSQGDEDGALLSFQEALKFNPHDAEAFFQAGAIYARRRAWDMSGTHYRMAGEEHEIRSSDFQERLKEIMGSALPEERKARLVRRKTAQLEQSLLTGGTAYYNAAAGFINAGEPDKALPCALKVAGHLSLKAKAEELIRRLRSRP